MNFIVQMINTQCTNDFSELYENKTGIREKHLAPSKDL